MTVFILTNFTLFAEIVRADHRVFKTGLDVGASSGIPALCDVFASLLAKHITSGKERSR
jgi:hypothetical protein